MQYHLLDAVKNFNKAKQHVLVIGDVMLDRYLIIYALTFISSSENKTVPVAPLMLRPTYLYLALERTWLVWLVMTVKRQF